MADKQDYPTYERTEALESYDGDEDDEDVTDDATEISKQARSDLDEDEELIDDDSSEYASDDEIVEELTLAEELEIERQNLREAKRRIGNLITQVTEYQQEMDQNRQDLEHRMSALSAQHLKYEESLQEEIDQQQLELEELQDINSKLKKNHVDTLQTILNEMRELEQKNAEYQKQLSESKQRTGSNATPQEEDLLAGLSLGNEQLNKILSMLQNVHAMCSEGASFYIPPIEEIIEAEKRKLADERKSLELQLINEQKKKDEALTRLAAQPENANAHYFKQIDEARKKLEHERTNAQMSTVHVTSMNNRLAELKRWVYESNEALMEERNRLTSIEDQINKIRQQLKPLHIKAKAMQIDETNESSSATSSSSAEVHTIGRLSPTPEYRVPKLIHSATTRGPLLRNPTRLIRASSDAQFMKVFDQGGTPSEENLSPGRANIKSHPSRYLLLSDPPLPGFAYSMLVVLKHVWVGCSDGTIRIYDKDTARPTSNLSREPASAVMCMEIVGRDIWTGHKDGSIKIWTSNGTFRDSFFAHTGQVTSIIRITSSVWSIGKDKMIHSWDARTRRMLKKKLTDAFMLCMCYDGADTVWVGADSQIMLFDAKTLKQTNTLTQHTKLVHHLIVVNDSTTSNTSGKTMWSSSSDHSVCVWDISTRSLIKQIITRVRGLRMVEFGSEVWCSTYNKSVLRIDKRSHHVAQRNIDLRYEDVHGDAVSTLVVVPDDCGARVWSGSWDKRISIWQNDHPQPRILTQKQKMAIITNWRQLFHGTNGTILSENCDVEETSSALAVIGKLVSYPSLLSQLALLDLLRYWPWKKMAKC